MRLTREVLRGEEVPAEAGDLAAAAGEAWSDGGVVGDTAAEQVADEGFNSVSFIEGHSIRALSTSIDLIDRCFSALSRDRAPA